MDRRRFFGLMTAAPVAAVLASEAVKAEPKPLEIVGYKEVDTFNMGIGEATRTMNNNIRAIMQAIAENQMLSGF